MTYVVTLGDSVDALCDINEDEDMVNISVDLEIPQKGSMMM